MSDTDDHPADDDTESAILRAKALILTARTNAEKTGADPVNAMMDLLIAACAIGHHAQPKTGTTEDILGDILSHAAGCARDWFPRRDH